MEEDIERESMVVFFIFFGFVFVFPFGKWPQKLTKRDKCQKINHLLVSPGDKPEHCSKQQNAAVISLGSEGSITKDWGGGQRTEKEK